MTLDLEDLTAGWNFRSGEICARWVVGLDGTELVQLRVDLGLMQMFPDGRPDGQRYRGLPAVLDYIRHEVRLGGRELEAEDWQALERELFQINYRRLALASLVEEKLEQNDADSAEGYLVRALRDIDMCLERIAFITEHAENGLGRASQSLQPTLVFHRGRLQAQRGVIEGRYEEAVEDAVQGQQDLDDLLAEMGLDDAQRAEDPGIQFLRDLGDRLRRQYGVTMTLRERLDEAVENEDFEAALRLRDELRRRRADPEEGAA